LESRKKAQTAFSDHTSTRIRPQVTTNNITSMVTTTHSPYAYIERADV